MQINSIILKPNNLSFNCWNTNYKYNEISDIPKLTCAKCGIPMLTQTQARNYFHTIKSKNTDEFYSNKYVRARDSIKVFSEVKKYVKPAEQKVITIMEKLAEKYPNYTFEEIFNNPKVVQPYTKTVNLKNKKQHVACQKIFSKMHEILPNLSPEESKTLYQINAKIFLASISKFENAAKKFKIARIYQDFIDNIKDEKQRQDFIRLVKKIPLKKFTTDRFIVSFIGKSDDQILNTLLLCCNSTASYIEDKVTKDNNKSLRMCLNCNTVNSNLPFAKSLSLYPEFAQNIQKQLDTIISYILKGHLRLHRDYPERIKQTISTQSEGTLDVNIDKIKPYIEEIKLIENAKKIWEKRLLNKPESIKAINRKIEKMRRILKHLKAKPIVDDSLINKYAYWLSLYEKKRLLVKEKQEIM